MRKVLRRKRAIQLVGCLALLASACAKQPMRQDPIAADQLDHRLMLNTYIEEGKLAVLAVNTDATRRRGKSTLIPLGIVIGNNGLPRMTVDRESLTLVDDIGRRYPLVTVEEVRRLGRQTVTDLEVSRRFAEVFDERLQAMSRVSAVFFPIQSIGPQRGIVQDRINLPRQHWMIDVVYFPHPEGELLGRKYELWFSPSELEDPVFVRFAVE